MAKSDSTEIEELSFRLYAERIAKMPAQVGGEAAASWAFVKAQDFIDVRDRVRSGEKPSINESKLADVCAPNLRPTHPHNLVSRSFADANGGEPKVLNRIKQICDWLDKNPRSDEQPVALTQLDRLDPSTRFDWDVPTTNIARVLLPHYATSK